MEKKLFDILKERGYVKDLTHEQEIIDLVNGEPMTFYLGIDPTADSLHIGHFFALTMFRWLQDFYNVSKTYLRQWTLQKIPKKWNHRKTRNPLFYAGSRAYLPQHCLYFFPLPHGKILKQPGNFSF